MAANSEGLPPEIEKLSERLAKDPKSLVFSPLANAYRKNNMIDEAIEILQKGLEIHSSYASARIVLGRCYLDKRMYELAKVEFTKAVEIDPQNIVALEKLGETYKSLNQLEDAYKIYKKLLELDPINENFEREAESLKNLTGEIAPDSEQFGTFQSIPEQKEEGKTEQKGEEKVKEEEPEAEGPTLEDVFEEPQEDASPKVDTPPLESQEEEYKKSEQPTLESPMEIKTEEEIKESEKKQDFEPPWQEEQSRMEDPVVKETQQELEIPELEKQPEEKPELKAETPTQDQQVKTEEQLGGITSLFEETNSLLNEEKSVTEEPFEAKEKIPETTKEPEIKEIIPPEENHETSIKETKLEEKPKKSGATETLAEIYLSQGFTDEAINIYKELLSNDPNNEKLKNKLMDLHKQTQNKSPSQNKEDEPALEKPKPENSEEDNHQQSKNLDNFQDWLNKFQK